ncbi:MAG: FtsW/RodA/SpoVE family cell cycle protein, partial [Cyanothece sp. SIO1E1]|nr:FtsW/RodA/SpoVE family cell cycle protein [Cyanothece sp. SIO1E1]
MLQRSLLRIRWKFLLQDWQEIDWLLLLMIVGLTVFGGIVIRSTELNQGTTEWSNHWVTGGVGLVLAMAIARWRYEVLVQWHWVIYAITNLALIAVMLIGTTASGAQRWVTLGGFNVQPSEFAK